MSHHSDLLPSISFFDLPFRADYLKVVPWDRDTEQPDRWEPLVKTGGVPIYGFCFDLSDDAKNLLKEAGGNPAVGLSRIEIVFDAIAGGNQPVLRCYQAVGHIHIPQNN